MSSRASWIALTGLSVLLATGGCGSDELESMTTTLQPPPAGSYDPSDGQGSAGSYGTGGDTDGTSTTGDTDTGEPNDCEDDSKRCPHEFRLADDGYGQVQVFGSFAPDGWENGLTMTLQDGSWGVFVPISWGTDTQYKFLVDGSWMTDPDNPQTVGDARGGESSVITAPMCGDYTCEPPVLGDFDWRDAIIYFVFVDRFHNGDPSNDGAIGVPMMSDWQGGDWAGVTQRIEEGYFEDLGVNVLWLTVPMDNTNADGLGVDGMDYSAYHGYWPTDLDAPEEHFGTLAELQQLVDTAHEHDLQVIFDYAMNHVHADSPVYTENPGWFWPNDNGAGGNCVCGQGCGWDGADGRRCWFTDYLPDFNFNEQAAVDFSVTNALQWIRDTGADGFRLDAVKHIEDAWLLELRTRVTEEIQAETGQYFYMVGETFTGDKGTIAYYVNPDMLDGQFDFPLRMEMARTVLMRQGSMQDLAAFMDDNDGFYGAAIMSTFIGNHDIPRCIHLAEDTPLWDNQWADGKDRAWNDQPGLTTGTSAFERLGNAFTILLTTPGAPLIYYGDEVGMPGAGDPDNRRFMQWDSYSAGQQGLYDHIKALIELRKAHVATRRGTRSTLHADFDTFTYSVTFGGDTVYVAVNRSDGSANAQGLPEGELTDELTGEMLQGPQVAVPARSARVMVAGGG